MSTTLSIRQIYDAARSAGFTPHQAVTWTAIAMAESGGRTGALNDKGEYSVGLWQINVNADASRASKWGNLNDPEANARAAYAISLHGRDMRPWTTTHDANKGTRADYRTYLGKVEKEIGVAGDPRGVHGYGSKMLTPLTESQYDKIDTGKPLSDSVDATGVDTADSVTDHAATTTNATAPGATTTTAASQTIQKDTDNDGLTDEFERLAGTDPTKADTDGDGLSDGYEAVISHTDPLSADTDGDRIGDAAEVAAGTDAGTVPGTAYVVGEGILAENVRGGVTDTDGDGISDRIEGLIGTDPNSADTDGDGLSDATEAALGTNPTVADSDHDGLTDGLEVQYGSDPLGRSGGPFDHTRTAPWTMQGAAEARAAAAAAAQQAVADPRPSGTDATANGAAASASSASQTNGGDTSDKLSIFLDSAKDQVGDRYVYGAPRTPTAKDPKTFDCSSFTQWAARQAGVKLNSTAETQYMQLKQSNHLIPVEQALKTKGALLFYFSREPSGALPAGQAHVAISLGDGRTVEAKGTQYGVGEWSAKYRFNYAATIPGISDEKGQRAHKAAIAAEKSDGLGSGVGSSPADKAAAASGAGVYGSTGSVDGDDDSASSANGHTAKAHTTNGHTVTGQGANGSVTTAANGTAANGAATNGGTGAGGTGAGGVVNGADGQTSTAGAYQIDAGKPVALRGAGAVDPDSDHDGLTDAFEKLAGTDPTKADTDGDGLSDGYEALVSHTDPLAADTDHDGMGDAQELSLGTDAGRLPGVAGVVGSGAYAQNVRHGVKDTDHDGLSDRTERLAGTNATKADTDGDGLSDSTEASLGTDPLKADTDGDGVSDGVEMQFHTDPLNADSTLGQGAGTAAGAGTGVGPGTGAGIGQPVGAGVGQTVGVGAGQTAGLGTDLGQGIGQTVGSGIGGQTVGGGLGDGGLGADGVADSMHGNAAEALELS